MMSRSPLSGGTAPFPTTAPSRSDQNVCGSLSVASRLTQATGPGGVPSADPGRNRQRLARTRTRADQRERLRGALGQPVLEAASADQARRNDRRLRLQHGQRLQTLGHRANPSTFGPDGCLLDVGRRIG